VAGLFNPPRIFNAVERPRLFRLIDENLDRGNILVVGQAAQGKSTLAASFLHAREVPVLWISLTSQDNNYLELYEKLLQRLGAFKKGPGHAGQWQVPQSTLGAGEDRVRHYEALSTLLHQLENRVCVVFDDFQVLDETLSGFELIQYLVESRYENLLMFLLSRTLPGFDFAKLRMNRQIFILENDNLAFTQKETRDFFRQTAKELSIDYEKIYKITHGWAGGLTLVSESMRQLKDMARLPARLSADLFSFFSQEIYDRLDPAVQKFLMTVSILETMDTESVDHLTGVREAQDILSRLEKRNLFIQRFYTETGEMKFRLHDLFRQFLLNNLTASVDGQALSALYRKAGLFFWGRKEPEQAVSYLVNAGSFPDIVKIIRIKGIDYLIKGRMSEPERWIGYLPEKLIETDPWLLFFKTMTRRIKGGRKNVARLETALRQFEKSGDDRGVLLCTGFLIEAAVFIRLPSARVNEWIDKGEQKLKGLGPSHLYPLARALLWQQIGLGYIAGSGNIPKGISACRNAILLSRQIKNTGLELNASVTMTFGHVQAADFIAARQMLSRVEQMAAGAIHPEYRALKGIVDIELALKNGEFDTAGELLETSQNEIEKFGLIFLYPAFVEINACYLAFTSRYDEAWSMADHLNDFSILEGNDFYSSISLRIRAIIDLYRQDYSAALQWISRAANGLDKARKGDLQYFLATQLKGILLFLTGSPEKAEPLLEKALAFFLKISSDLSASETALVLGLVLCETGNRTKGCQYLQQGIETAERNRYAVFPMLEGRMLSRALVQAVICDPSLAHRNHVLNLTAKIRETVFLEQMGAALAGLKKKEQATAKEQLRPLYKQVLPKITIRSLGEFGVYKSDNPDDPVVFEGSRPILLLKAIVYHGGRDIPRDILIDNLWPDADAASGEKNFKINLHRLRKTIEASPKKQFGYSYVLLRSGLISLDPQLVQIDTDRFMQLGNQGRQCEQVKQPEQALALYEEAVTLYRGDYFAEEPYIEWLRHKRDLYRTRYMEILEQKARLHEELDQADKAIETWQTVLQTDPFFEKAYQNLMILYTDTGRRHTALSLFENCRMVFEEELGVVPDNRTRQIYEQILAR
jgi:LuxR family maltose regulon positive regulatory protein